MPQRIRGIEIEREMASYCHWLFFLCLMPELKIRLRFTDARLQKKKKRVNCCTLWMSSPFTLMTAAFKLH